MYLHPIFKLSVTKDKTFSQMTENNKDVSSLPRWSQHMRDADKWIK